MQRWSSSPTFGGGDKPKKQTIKLKIKNFVSWWLIFCKKTKKLTDSTTETTKKNFY